MELEEGGNYLFIAHQNADPDAIGSMYLLWSRYDGVIGLPNDPDSRGKRLVEYLEIEPVICPEIDGYDKIVIVDTPDPRQLEPITIPETGFIVIDHHQNNLWENDVIHEDRTSCVEMIYDMIEPDKISTKEAVAILAGILTDTSGLRRGDSFTFRTLSRIMSKTDVTIDLVQNILSRPRSYSEKICRLKGASRSYHSRVNGILICSSSVSSYESSVCNSLLNTGADVAFVASKKNDEILVSARVKSDLVENGFDLGIVFKKVTEVCKTVSGGGHQGAGVLRGKGDVKTVLDCLIKGAEEHILSMGIERSKD